ncbi:hypothetical protein Taro_053250, partial [Colocasia esculenta]|nr:hypothetical protein [Colocasia esculenta]
FVSDQVVIISLVLGPFSSHPFCEHSSSGVKRRPVASGGAIPLLVEKRRSAVAGCVYITLSQWCRHSLPVCRHSLSLPEASFEASSQWCRHSLPVCQHTLTEAQKRKSFGTHGCLGIKGFDLEFCAHAPQATAWTYGAINTHDPRTPRETNPIQFPEKASWRQKGFFQILLHLQKLQTILSRGRTCL